MSTAQAAFEAVLQLTTKLPKNAPVLGTKDGDETFEEYVRVVQSECAEDAYTVELVAEIRRRLKFFPALAEIYEVAAIVRDAHRAEYVPARPTVCNECGDSGWCPMVRGTDGWRPWSLEIDGSSVVPTTRRCGCRKQGAA